jgi:hypothetical protein
MRRFCSLTLVWALCACFGAVAAVTPALAAAHHHTATAHATATRAATTTHAASSKVSDAVGLKVLNDCQAHGQFTHDWTRAELKKALSMVSAMTNQYSSCSTDLHNALANGIKVKVVSGGSGSGSGTTIIIVIVVVLIVLAALLGGLALRRRGQSGGPPPSAA